jgi:hydrogenase nickel incorporation protein HypA/HybF
MHEFSLVTALLNQVGELMRQQQADRVISIRVNVGEFCGVDPELFRIAYDILVDTSPVHGAQLRLEQVPLESRCGNCGHEFGNEYFCFVCPACKSKDVTIVRGEDLVLESLTLEQSEASIATEMNHEPIQAASTG